MNIFYLSRCPKRAAQYHCDDHFKMICEYAQQMSTTHRVLDGEHYTELSKAGRKVHRWKLYDERENVLYKASHANHPCNLWVRESSSNYLFIYDLYVHLAQEFYDARNKHHQSYTDLYIALRELPNNIPDGPFTTPHLCMPDEFKTDDAVESYRTFYNKDKSEFATWKNRETPYWFRNEFNQRL